MTEPRPNRRIQIVAVGFAAAALATAMVAVVVVATRSTPEPPPPPSQPRNVVEDRDVAAADILKLDKSYTSTVWSISSDGLRVDDAALRKALGLDGRDVITAVSGRSLVHEVDVQRAVFDLSILEAKTAYVEVMRDHRAVLYRWKIDGDLREARRASSADLLGRSTNTWATLGGTGSATVDLPAPPPDPVNPFVATVKVIDDTHLEVPKSTFDAFFADPGAFSHDVRVVPSVSNGHPNGFKLYAIRPTSLLAALHFKNGDTIMSINGADLSTSGSQSLDVYSRLKSAKQFVIDMIRRGSPMTMTIDVK
jgi:S1-C subfamily serine protease